MAGNVNETGCRTLDKLGADPRVDKVFAERECGRTSYWVWLKAGWWCPNMECGTIHEWSVRDVLAQARTIERDPRPADQR